MQIGAAVLVVCVAAVMRLNSDAQENSPLAEAVERNDIQAATELLESGADPNQFFTFDNQTAHCELWNNATAQWQWLKNRTGSFDSPQRESLLWMTAQQRHFNDTEMAHLLLRYGANPNRAGNDGDTALLYAAGEGNAAFVKLLIASGADANQKGMDGRTPLTHAIGSACWFNLQEESRYRNGQICHDGFSENYRPKFSETTRLLIVAGANVNTPMVWNPKETPLRYARREGLYDITNQLTRAGAK